MPVAVRKAVLLAVLVLYAVLARHDCVHHGGKNNEDGKQNVLLHEAVRTLLGFKESPSQKADKLIPNPDTPDQETPQYMYDLYEKFKNSEISKGQLSGNTVRSIHGKLAEVNGEAMFVFNLTSVLPSERLLSAEIHLYKRKSKPWNRKRDVELLMYEIAPHYMSESRKITMRAQTFGWQWYDVTDVVSSCLAARRETPHLFALSFQTERSDGRFRTVALKKFMRHHSTPFLVVYSNDTQNMNLEQLDVLAEKLLEDKNSHSSYASKDKPDTIVKSDSILVERTSGETRKPNVDTTRQKRSIFTNEIPEDPADYKELNLRFNIPQTHPGILQTRKETRHRSDSSLIPYPDKAERRKNRRRRKMKKSKRKNRKSKNVLLLPDKWENSYHENLAIEENSGTLCAKRKLIVDFDDIGWGEWIISPKSFEAHYCAGTCPFPLTKRLRPSNHATIQSIVNAIGIYTDVPAPCCVPDSLSSVTLLYFDENRNVVLRNYPSMTVQSCACR